jgi:hypothetical protein
MVASAPTNGRQLAANRRREETLVLGPLTAAAVTAAGIALPERIEHRPGSDDLTDWAAANTKPGDLVILPIRDLEFRSAAIELFESGRSVLAVTHNPESQSPLSGSSMTLPVGGSIAPT